MAKKQNIGGVSVFWRKSKSVAPDSVAPDDIDYEGKFNTLLLKIISLKLLGNDSITNRITTILEDNIGTFLKDSQYYKFISELISEIKITAAEKIGVLVEPITVGNILEKIRKAKDDNEKQTFFTNFFSNDSLTKENVKSIYYKLDEAEKNILTIVATKTQKTNLLPITGSRDGGKKKRATKPKKEPKPKSR